MTEELAQAFGEAIARDPYEARSYAVLGDWLQQRGDPRGELIALQLAAEADPALAEEAEAFLVRHRATLVPGGYRESLTWRAGFIRRVTISPFSDDKAAAVRAIFGHPSGQFVAELYLGYHHTRARDSGAPLGDLQPAIDALTAVPRPALRVLHVGSAFLGPEDSTMQGADGTFRDVGSLGALWAAAPRLARLVVIGQRVELGAIDAPELTSMQLATFAASDATARAIATAHWPGLEQLAVSYGRVRDRWVGVLAEIRRLVARTDLPELRRLAIRGADFGDELCEALPAAPLVRQLATLELSRCQITDAGAATLATHADAFAHLDELDLHANQLGAAGIAAVTRVARHVTLGDQDEPGDAIEDVYDY